MNWIGCFSITKKGNEIKGIMMNFDMNNIVKVYLNPEELRKLSSACLEIAEHLEENIAKSAQPNAKDQTAGALPSRET